MMFKNSIPIRLVKDIEAVVQTTSVTWTVALTL